MKKTFCFILSIVLLLSLVVIPVALADESTTTTPTATLKTDGMTKVKELVASSVADFANASVAAGSYDIGAWLSESNGEEGAHTAKLRDVFDFADLGDIKINGDEGYTANPSTGKEEGQKGIVGKIEYFKPSEEIKTDKCPNSSREKTVEFNKVGTWYYRFIVEYWHNEKNSSDEIETKTETIGKTDLLSVEVYDNAAPVITERSLSSTSSYKEITIGATETSHSFTVPSYSTYFSATDDANSSISATYVVYKNVNGNWTKIYDSKTSTVTEGYEKVISTSGVITATESDVADTATYRISYDISDAYGFHAVNSDDETYGFHYDLLVKKSSSEDNEKTSTVSVWKIILYVIAGLSAVGIVVVIFIKPKKVEQESANGRVHYGNDEAADNSFESTDNTDSDKE